MTPPTPPPTSDGRGERLGAIRARVEAATPGPWRWYGHVRGNLGGMYLGRMRPGWGRCTVMDFVRHGMKGAQPRFADQETQRMTKAEEMPVFEVCPDATSRDDRRVYRDDIVGIRHPDAEFIAHAREDIPWLLAALTMEPDELARTVIEAARGFLAYSQRARQSTPDPEEWYVESEHLARVLATFDAAALTTALPEPTDVPDEREPT